MNLEIVILMVFVSFPSLLNSAILSSSDYSIESTLSQNSGGISMGGDFTIEGISGQNFSSRVPYQNQTFLVRTGFYNPPRFQFQKGLGVSYTRDGISVFFPANSVDLERFDIFLWDEPLNPNIEDATKKLSKIKGVDVTSAKNFNFYFFDDKEITTKLLKKGNVTVKVEDKNGDGYIDASGPKIKFKTLEGYVYDEKYNMWTKAFNNRVSYYSNYALVSFDVVGGGIFGVFGDVDASVKDVYAFPVPFRPNGPKAGVCDGCSGSDEDGITFVNVPYRGYIEIYTVDGRLVKKIVINEATIISSGGGSSMVKWDTKNENGDKVASGVYIWRVVSESYLPGYKNVKTGKIVIIR